MENFRKALTFNLVGYNSTNIKNKNSINNMRFQNVKGTRDFLPKDAIKFNKIVEIVKNTFEKYGFAPLYTPALESFELLSAKGGLGEAVKNEIYYFKDKANREIGLRFDLTMPLVRVFTSGKFILPFKRYQIEKVWRYDEPQAFRWREFWQADIDIIGSPSVLADAECLACVCECLEKLGFKDFYIRVNDRRIVESILEEMEMKDKKNDIMRIIDKLDRFGENWVKKELGKLGIDAEKILKSLSLKELRKNGIKEKAKDLMELLKYSKQFGFEKRLKIDPYLVRGLDYYTGLVYEVYLGGKVSCGGGGRYDNLIEAIGGQPTPATGISLGLDRIFENMKERNIFSETLPIPKVFVANVDENVKVDAIKIAQKLRKNNIPCEIDLTNKKFSKQLDYANAMEIPYVIIVGKEELKARKFKLKDMRTNTQKTLKLEDIIRFLKGKFI